jgi:hypothetical protein
MKEALVDVAVLLVFFTRHEQFKRVFEQVKKARPSKLFLYQDGPRERNKNDIENISKCRAIAENIEWKCEVHKYYQEKNVGCDPSGYIASKWVFSNVDKCIVLEDDVVPSVSFFSFLKMMLDKYENDERIMLVTGVNSDEISKEITSDYFFSSTTITMGAWASWARVVKQWDTDYRFLKDKNAVNMLQSIVNEKKYVKNFINICNSHGNSGIKHFETLLISNQYLNSGLTIIPKKNMINNIGVTDEGTHFSGTLNLLPRGYRKIFTMQRFEIDTTKMNHPLYVIDDREYQKRAYRIQGWGHPLIKIYRLVETSFYKLKCGDFKSIVSDLKNKYKKFVGRTSS